MLAKRNRKNPNETEDLAYYYTISGVIFPCPRLYALLRAKMEDASLALDQLFDLIYDQYSSEYAEELQKKYKLNVQELFD